MNLQPFLENHILTARPLLESDFQILFEAASDPLIWEQHPNKNRFQLDVFRNFFDHAIVSKGALIIMDKNSGMVIGSSRFYNLDLSDSSIFIGYTFFKCAFWGGKYNYSIKALMLDYAFQFLNKVYFHIGKYNLRSQKSIERLGAIFQKEIEMAYAGEQVNPNFEYLISKDRWPELRKNIENYLQN
ncbi:MAG: GNAT family N-acetyltransferase [Saprospiraceae bacterium]